MNSQNGCKDKSYSLLPVTLISFRWYSTLIPSLKLDLSIQYIKTSRINIKHSPQLFFFGQTVISSYLYFVSESFQFRSLFLKLIIQNCASHCNRLLAAQLKPQVELWLYLLEKIGLILRILPVAFIVFLERLLSR